MLKLRDLAAKAGKWLGLAAATPAAHAGAIEADRFDEMTWRDIHGQAAALRELIEDLGQRHDYSADLIRDLFLAAFKAAPQVRDASEMDPSRLPNRQVISSLLETPEFDDLRRETVGDPYASAMAVLAQADALRRILEQAREAQEAADETAQARQDQQDAADGVDEALQQVAGQADADGNIPDEAAAATQAAMDAADQADQEAAQAGERAAQALAAAAPGMRATARAAASRAADQAREEAALMASWGIGPGELERMDFATRARLAERLRSGKLGQFAKLIGRFRQMAAGQRARKTEHAPGELVGITLGDDITTVIPAELATLAVPAMRADFAARYVQRQLMVYDQRGEVEAGQGAIIACVDTSGSMRGDREAWAKACALALLDQARAGRRDMAVILFSSAGRLRTFRFPGGQGPMTDVIDMAETVLGGGTDFETPLGTAAGLLEAEFNADGHMKGDIVLITDGECGVSEEWMRAWNTRKDRLGFRVFGVAIGRQPGDVLDALSDNVRTIDDLTTPEDAADIFRVT